MMSADEAQVGRRVFLVVTAEVTALTFYRGYLAFLRAQGWDVTIIAAGGDALVDFAADQGAHAEIVAMEREISPVRDLSALLRLRALIVRDRPVAVVAATPKAGLLAMLAARSARTPVRIYQVWGLRLETLTGLKRRIVAATERTAIASATLVVANSASLRDAVYRNKLAAPGSIGVLGPGSSHGVDVDRFSPEASPLPALPDEVAAYLARHEGELIIGFIGRLTPDKGVEALLSAVQDARRAATAVRLLVLGSPESTDTFDAVRAAVERADAVWVDHTDDVRPYLRAMDVLCLPTHREGFPNVVLEAAAMEVPAIVTDATGAVDSVVPDVTGIVVGIDDAEAIARTLRMLAADRPLVVRLGQAARERARNEFEKTRIWQLQVDALRDEVDRHRHARRRR